jgi:hypothetical protein
MNIHLMGVIFTNMNADDLDKSLKNLALLITVHAVRNTVIEDYHANDKITDPEMMAFNKEVVNRIYTFLQIIINPIYTKEKAVLSKETITFYLPHGWDEPKLNKSILAALKQLANS